MLIAVRQRRGFWGRFSPVALVTGISVIFRQLEHARIVQRNSTDGNEYGRGQFQDNVYDFATKNKRYYFRSSQVRGPHELK